MRFIVIAAVGGYDYMVSVQAQSLAGAFKESQDDDSFFCTTPEFEPFETIVKRMNAVKRLV